ncbi:MAG: hypothetical protein WEB59_06190 [Thermoanaerobaculia bacterium]
MNSTAVRLALVGVLLGLLAVVAVVRSRRKPDISARVGGLYSVESGDRRFGVAKVLVVEAGIVHVRVYAEKFPTRPSSLDESTLSLGTIHDQDFGIGHLALQPAGFAAWQPALIKVVPVKADELDGYEEWKRAGGGVWN